jgi:adenosylmethionine-8-amino-7-oxononanoate aminotransferase
VNVHGHRHPAINAAIRDQLDRLEHSTLLGPTHPGAIELAARLCRIAPEGLTRVFFSDSGSTAVEIALKIAFQYWKQKEDPKPKKEKFLAFTLAYHGDTVGSVSVGGIDLFHEVYRPLLFDTYRAPCAYCYRCPLKKTFPDCGIACLDEVARILRDHREEIAAVVIEPKVHGASGMIVQPSGYLKRLEELCRRYGVLLIADEVATGFGRTGRMFACELEEVRPDLLCVAKAITGGTLPLAATLATEGIFEAFLGEHTDWKTFFHGHTYTGNPLACAAALASLDIFDRERTLEGLQKKIRCLEEALAPLKMDPHVGEIRQAGFMVGIELVRDRTAREPFPPGERRGWRVCREARKEGLLVRPLGDVIVLMPPYVVTEEEIRWMVGVVGQAIERAR